MRLFILLFLLTITIPLRSWSQDKPSEEETSGKKSKRSAKVVITPGLAPLESSFVLGNAALDPGTQILFNEYLRTGRIIYTSGTQNNIVTHPFQVSFENGKSNYTIGQQSQTQFNLNDALNPNYTGQDFLNRGKSILKLNNGHLIAIKSGITKRNVSAKAEWVNFPNWESNAKSFKNDPGQKKAEYFFRSVDSGFSWQEIAMLDPESNFEGWAAWPTINDDGKGTLSPGGFHQTAYHYDNWSGRIYMSMQGRAGFDPKLKEKYKRTDKSPDLSTYTGIAYSDDTCKTWKLLWERKGIETPIAMTTTADGRFVAVYVFQGNPNILYTTPGFNQKQFLSIKHTGAGSDTRYLNSRVFTLPALYRCENDTLSSIRATTSPQLSIVRQGQNSVRLCVNIQDPKTGRQGLAIARFNLNGGMNFSEQEYLFSEHPEWSIPYATFISSSLADCPGHSFSSDNAVLYYLESTRRNKNQGKLVANANYRLYGETGIQKMGPLNTQSGQAQTFNADAAQQGATLQGAAFYANDTMSYMTFWNMNQKLNGNVISRKNDTIKLKTLLMKLRKGFDDETGMVWFAEAHGGIIHHDQNTSQTGSQLKVIAESPSRRTFWGFTFGNVYRDRLGASIGFQLSTIEQQIKFTDLSNDYQTVLPKNRIVDIPINLQYRFMILYKRLYAIPAIGFDILFIGAGENADPHYRTIKGNNGKEIAYSYQTLISKPTALSIRAGVAAEYLLFSKWSVQFKADFLDVFENEISTTIFETPEKPEGVFRNSLGGFRESLILRYYFSSLKK
ncbi:MAG: hypothetical protein JNJ58_13090 [Chitinophagaceae bacterium]|nr:hypothetical protein [Chitinophagaceae bacterium]